MTHHLNRHIRRRSVLPAASACRVSICTFVLVKQVIEYLAREAEAKSADPRSKTVHSRRTLRVYIYVYTYIGHVYIYIRLYMYMYIYIYISADPMSKTVQRKRTLRVINRNV